MYQQQWWIQDFPEGGVNLLFSWKLYENEEILVGGGRHSRSP